MPILLTDVTARSNGARFYTVDLHVHSYEASTDADDTMRVEAIIDSAAKQGLGVIALTDHNCSTNVARSVEYARTAHGDRLLVLPAVEISTANGHLLAYFPPERQGAVQDLLSRIGIVGAPGSRDSHTAQSMAEVVRVAHELGGLCIAAHIDRARYGFEALQPGYPNWKADVITSAGLYGLEFDDAAHLAWYSPDDAEPLVGAERRKLYERRRSAEGTSARPVLAAVQGSDAHTMAQFEGSKRRTRLKMQSLTFSALRVALIDPGARTRVLATLPAGVPRIIGMHVTGGFLASQAFHFSPNLNCFIGGRGTGKSTAIKSLAYGLGALDDLSAQDNCPDVVVTYCRDANGVLYRYERQRGGDVKVQAKEENQIDDVPADSFRVEYYGQGDLTRVAEDPLLRPDLLQTFLDRHIVIGDLVAKEEELRRALEQNSALLKPLEAQYSGLASKEAALKDVRTKLKIAETGKVREIAADQTRLSAERQLSAALAEISSLYASGFSLSKFKRDYGAVRQAHGELTGDAAAAKHFADAAGVLVAANATLDEGQASTNLKLREHGERLQAVLAALGARHRELEEALSLKMEALRQQGLSGTLNELQQLLNRETALVQEVARIKTQSVELRELRAARTTLLDELTAARDEVTRRRKAQCAAVNGHLKRTIRDYLVFLRYDAAGITDEFAEELLSVMHGSYFNEEQARRFCASTTPLAVANAVRQKDVAAIAAIAGIGGQWAGEIVQRYGLLENLHRLETIAKPARPLLTVRTRGDAPRDIPVAQLSDGQKHTILLTIAMLSEAAAPLIIDQPEDDLDNAFVFETVVETLRTIKEHRQVILVTHNANIAVLGDSELILPMRREGEVGSIHQEGSIDRRETSRVAQDVLEGGPLAFMKRKEIYGH